MLLAISLAMGEKVSWQFDMRALLAWGDHVVFGWLNAFSAYPFLLANISLAIVASDECPPPVIALLFGGLGGLRNRAENE